VPTVPIAPPDVARLLAEDAVPKLGPFRYGVVLPAEVDVAGQGALDATPDGRLVSRVRIHAPGAKSLGLEFSRYELPPGGQLFVYDDGLVNVLGAYDQRNRIPTGEFVIEPFPGESVILEYSQPGDIAAYGELVVSGVIYDYKDILALERGWNQPEGNETEGGCPLVDVNCPEGAPFPELKRAALRTFFGGGVCSGSLINNTANDGTRYVYTANHCGQGSTTVFRFNYQTSGCGSGTAPTNQNVSGATVLANDLDTDGRLLRITNAIPGSYLPYFAGWSRQTANLTFGVSMHHPSGGPKKISIDNNGGGQTTANFVGIGSVKVWAMSFHVGSTEGGSSGGPLFDQNDRIRGTLTGGPSGNCAVSYYGRFHSFWNETTIAQWLDPLGTGQTTLDGFDPFGVPPAIANLTPSTVDAFSPGTVTISGTGLGSATSVQVGATVLTTGLTLIDENTLQFIAPQPAALGNAAVTVTTPAGTSNALQLGYVATSPPELQALTLALGGQNFTWNFGGNPGHFWFLIVTAPDLVTFPFAGTNVLLNAQIIGSGLLSPVGIGSKTLLLPAGGIGDEIDFHSQIITFDGLSLFKGSNIVTTTKFF
ncbi:MAG TPA: IPT/TIG domain-containing protein, partial [Planctomycetota bacterium]|nr:IPT/TIG domain-containing protein [Planctomycetota bacterium]